MVPIRFFRWLYFTTGIKYIYDTFNEFSSATEIYLTGRTSGGIGIMANLPNLYHLLINDLQFDQNNTLIKGIIDSGWVVDYDEYTEQVCTNTDTCTVKKGIQLAKNMWNPILSSACLSKYPNEDELYKCYLGLYAYEFITIDVLIIENQDDPIQLINLGDPSPNTTDEIEYAIEIQERVKQEIIDLANVTNYFLPSCEIHGILDQIYWSDIIICQNDTNC